MEPGRDYIGVGWAPSCRTPGIGSSWHSVTLTTARNEAETWEFPRRSRRLRRVASDPRSLEHAVRREFAGGYGMTIEVTGQLGAFNHVLLGERQHWVSITYLASIRHDLDCALRLTCGNACCGPHPKGAGSPGRLEGVSAAQPHDQRTLDLGVNR